MTYNCVDRFLSPKLVLLGGYMIYKLNLLRSTIYTCVALTILTLAGAAQADEDKLSCPVSHGKLKSALVSADNADTTGFNNHFWAVVVNRGGVVCAVSFSGTAVGSQWLASRQIAAAKAFTANGLSLNTGSSTGTGALCAGRDREGDLANGPLLGEHREHLTCFEFISSRKASVPALRERACPQRRVRNLS